MVSWQPENSVRRFWCLYKVANVIECLDLFDTTTLSWRGCRVVEVLGASVAYHLDGHLPTIASSLSLKYILIVSMILHAGRGRTTSNGGEFRLT